MRGTMDIVKYLEQFQKVTEDPTLEGVEYILEKLGNPHKGQKYIHVAGTNGKGSICEMLCSVLVKQGYKVGMFITPYLLDIKEEMTINNVPITQKEYEEILETFPPIIEEYNNNHKIKIKWFEVRTALALKYFKNNNCDISIIETGLGGTNDCTNVIDSLVSIIGNIGYDHMDLLGNTIEEIASHKAGIIKPNQDTVFVHQDKITPIIEEKCKKENNTLHLIKKEDVVNYSYNQEYQRFNYENYNDLEINLKGKEQIYNATCCVKCFEIIEQKGFKVSKDSIKKGFKNTVHKGRFEILLKEPTVIFDGGHNENAILNFQKNLEQYYNSKEYIYIYSVLKTKDYKTILKHLTKDKSATFYFTDGTGEDKYVPKEELYEYAYSINKNLNLRKQTLKEAIKESIKEDKIICIIGSFYIYKDVTNTIKKM